MVDVVQSNYRVWLPEIEQAIADASFVAIDFEFLGVPTVDDSVSLFDTPDERYAKTAACVRKFPPCQMGIACFRESPHGEHYEVEVFSLAVFKRLAKKVFSFSLPALKFLSKHNFDFNKFIAEGITYANRTEVAKLKKELLSGDIDFDVFADGLEHRIHMLKLRLLEEARESVTSTDDMALRKQTGRRHRISEGVASGSGRGPPGTLHLLRPILIELCPVRKSECTTESEGPAEPLWDRELTSVEAAVVVYVLSEEHPNCDFQFDHSRTMLYCAEQPLMFRVMKDNGKRAKTALKNLLNELYGLSLIVHTIAEKKVPLVAHNSFLDLMYLYHCFEADLPGSYAAFKKDVHTMFPTVIDTKVLAGTVQNKLNEHGVSDLSLQTLGSYFDSPSCGQILPFLTPEINGGAHSQGVFTEGEHYHNAAFDALITGEVFIKLAYLYAYTRSAGQADFSQLWPLRKLIFASRGEVGNRIPLPLIDSLYADLTKEEDPVGNRPDIVRVLPRRKLPTWLPSWALRGNAHKICLLIHERLVPEPEASEKSARDFRDAIRMRFGGHRVDARRSDDGKAVLVATNTPTTFVKMCSWVCLNADYRLEPVLEQKTFDEKLLHAGNGKNKKKKRRVREKGPTAKMRILSIVRSRIFMASVSLAGGTVVAALLTTKFFGKLQILR